MEKTSFNIFKSFFKVGTLLLGGGYVILPLLKSELVDKRKWITPDKLYEFYALSSSLPGIIAANISIFTGRTLLGTRGAIAAIVGVTLPAFIAIILLASFFGVIVRFAIVQNIFWGIGIGVITLLFLAIKEMWKTCVNDVFTTVMFIICLILAIANVPPAIIILFAVFVGLLRQKLSKQGVNNA